jgi:acylphosphatase
MKSVRVYISGTVQGVMFRKFIEEQANLIGVRGFVRNMDDGRVEAIIEGINEKVDKMIEICKTGNKHSQIRDVLVQEIKYQGFEGFKVSKL